MIHEVIISREQAARENLTGRPLPDGRLSVLRITPINNGALYSPFTAHDPRLPADLPDCYVVGISGACGGSCPVLHAGRCETQDEMEPALPLDAQERLGHERLANAIAQRDR